MRKQQQKSSKKMSFRSKWFMSGTLVGATALTFAFASVTPVGAIRGRVTDDTALYQSLSEIRVKKEARVDFDSDISKLSRLEDRFRGKEQRLPRVSAPMARVQKMKYRYSSSGVKTASSTQQRRAAKSVRR